MKTESLDHPPFPSITRVLELQHGCGTVIDVVMMLKSELTIAWGE
jgi:hypothetical protein